MLPVFGSCVRKRERSPLSGAITFPIPKDRHSGWHSETISNEEYQTREKVCVFESATMARFVNQLSRFQKLSQLDIVYRLIGILRMSNIGFVQICILYFPYPNHTSLQSFLLVDSFHPGFHRGWHFSKKLQDFVQ